MPYRIGLQLKQHGAAWLSCCVVQEKQVLKQVALPKAVYTGSCTQLFDFLAVTLADFIREQQQVRTCHTICACIHSCKEEIPPVCRCRQRGCC